MVRHLLAVAVVIASASAAHAQLFPRLFRSPPTPTYPPQATYQQGTTYPPSTVILPQPQPQREPPAVGLAAVSSPFWFGPDYSIGGPGYLYRATPPYNGWSSGYRGAYYGEPVPGAAAYRGRWSR